MEKPNSRAEENYIKAIYKLAENQPKVATNSIAAELETKASSVTDMLRKLADKSLIHYKKYQGVRLTDAGEKLALKVIRKHRLWEVFLVEKLKFGWDQVHDIAEQLEHIASPELVNKLDAFLGYPKFDPHGDPIPDADGNLPDTNRLPLAEVEPGKKYVVRNVTQDNTEFLSLVESLGLTLGLEIELIKRVSFDQSLIIKKWDGSETLVTQAVSKNILVSKSE